MTPRSRVPRSAGTRSSVPLSTVEPILQTGVQASAAAAVVGDLDHQRVAVAADA